MRTVGAERRGEIVPDRLMTAGIFRFVARMQEAGATALLLEGSEGGHDYPDEYTQTADMAMQMSFFIDALMEH